MSDALEYACGIAEQMEGCSLTAYVDEISTTRPITIGFGCTHWWDGGKVPADAVLASEDEARELMMLEMVPTAMRIWELAPGITEGILGAMTDFAYNCGIGALLGSTLWRKYKSGDNEGAIEEYGKWVKSGGQVRRGLVRRRKMEADLHKEGVPYGD